MISEVKMFCIVCDGCGCSMRAPNWDLITDESSEALNASIVDDWLFKGEGFMGKENQKHYCENCWTLDDNDEPKILNDVTRI